jgi:uncharacterized protein with von Willebrand factor type A (vWA) domain
MFAYSDSSITELWKQQVGTQISLYTELTKNFAEATQRMTALNLAVAKRMVENYQSNAKQLLEGGNTSQISSGTLEQQVSAFDKIYAYQQNVNDLAAETRQNFERTMTTHWNQAGSTEGRKNHEGHASHSGGQTKHEHGTDEPSPLVEKLIASVVEPENNG